MELLDKLRKVTIGAKYNPRFEIVEIDGEEFEVRQPTIRQRDDLHEKSIKNIPDQNGEFESKVDLLSHRIWSVILFTFVPKTNKRVFSDGDFDSMASSFTRSFVDKIYEVFDELSTVDVRAEKKT